MKKRIPELFQTYESLLRDALANGEKAKQLDERLLKKYTTANNQFNKIYFEQKRKELEEKKSQEAQVYPLHCSSAKIPHRHLAYAKTPNSVHFARGRLAGDKAYELSDVKHQLFSFGYSDKKHQIQTSEKRRTPMSLRERLSPSLNYKLAARLESPHDVYEDNHTPTFAMPAS